MGDHDEVIAHLESELVRLRGLAAAIEGTLAHLRAQEDAPRKPKRRSPRTIPAMKLCPKCGETKAEALFYRNRARYDGLANVCKDCQDKYVDNARRRRQEAEAAAQVPAPAPVPERDPNWCLYCGGSVLLRPDPEDGLRYCVACSRPQPKETG